MATEIDHTLEKKLIHALFFLFGFGIMAWIPRFPEVKANLHLNNGAFGSIMSTGSIGAFLGLLTVGHIIHRFGAFKVTIAAILTLFSTLGFLVHIHTSFLFLIFNIGFGFGITAVHVCINSQAFHFLQRSSLNLITSSAGFWSSGSLLTAILSGLLIGRVGLVAHMDTLAAVLTAAMIAIVIRLRPVLIVPNTKSEHDYTIKEIFTSFRVDWPVSLGMACVVYLEFALGDWGTIFTKDRLNMSGGLSAAPFVIFTAMMIVGRLMIQRMLVRAPIHLWVKRAALFAGLGFATCITIATHLSPTLKWWSYGLFILGFAVAGLGSSFTAPSFFAAANRRSNLPSAVVVGQFGVVNNALTFVIKWIVAWTIQFTGSIALALMIPAAMMVAGTYFTKALKEDSQAKS
jgi:MFS family permease